MKHQQKKNNKNKTNYWRTFNRVLIVIELIIIAIASYTIYTPNNIISYTYLSMDYQFYVNKYHNNPHILNVTNLCRNATDQVYCVWKNTPYDYDYDRAKLSLEIMLLTPLILNPDDYFDSGGKGVCRDNAAMIKSVLDNLNIESEFTFKPNHVYITANHNNTIYKIDTHLYITNSEGRLLDIFTLSNS